MVNTLRIRILAVSLLLIATCAKTAPGAESFPPIGGLGDACREAKAEYRPLSEIDLEVVRDELAEAFERLDGRLSRDGENGALWREFLWCDRLEDALQSESPLDVSTLARIDKRFTAEQEGLNLVWFVDVHQAMRRYRSMDRSIDNPRFQPTYEALLDALAERVEAYASEPTADVAVEIGQAVGQLEDFRQVPQLVRAIRHHFSHPNLFFEVSADLISAGMSMSVDETGPVRDVILGADIRGTGHTTGQLCVSLVPDADRAAIDMVLQTTTQSQNIARKGGVRIYNNGTTVIGTQKSVWLDEQGFSTMGAVSQATTRTTITGIRSDRGSNLIEKAARRRAEKQQREAECIGSLHAEQQSNRRVDQEVGERLSQANAAFVDKFRVKLVGRKLFPQQLRFSTTEQALQIVGLQADASRLAAATPPPELPDGSDIALRLHQSMVDNFAAGALAGRTVDDQQLRKIVVDLLGEMPEVLEVEEENDERWAVSFDRDRPITVTFAEGMLTLVIRGSKYTKGKTAYPAMNITAIYKIEPAAEGFKAIRQGDLQIFPPGFDPQSGDTLSTSLVVIRRLLERRMGKFLGEEIELGSFVVPDQWLKVGQLRPLSLAAENGWLTVCWEMASPGHPAGSNP